MQDFESCYQLLWPENLEDKTEDWCSDIIFGIHNFKPSQFDYLKLCI